MAREHLSFYGEYKPFRNLLRRFDCLEGLVDIWAYSMYVMGNRPLPGGYLADRPRHDLTQLKNLLFPCDLDILSREFILNCGHGGECRLVNWRDLARVMNHVRRLDEKSYMAAPGGPTDIEFEFHRIVHRQFPWQTAITVNEMMRVFKVFGQAAVEAIVQRELGMTMDQFLLLGMALRGHFEKQWGLAIDCDYSVIGAPKEATRRFLERISKPIGELRVQMQSLQSYDNDWLYTWNPLEATPLVAFDPGHPERVCCPIPRYLARRASAGLFYDLVRASDFDNSFGHSFQSYVGEVIDATCKPPRFTITAEASYQVGDNKMHGVDWILSDASGHLFIEAKAKRLTVNARTQSDTTALSKDVDILAGAIVQHYRNVQDALAGRTQWHPDSLPVYTIVLTLEDWLLFAPGAQEMLADHVRRRLAVANIPEQVLGDMPYTVTSAAEFEVLAQVIAQVGIARVMDTKKIPKVGTWSFAPAVIEHFPAEMRKVNYHLFGDELRSLFTDVQLRHKQSMSGGKT